jgi:hypothetical protein
MPIHFVGEPAGKLHRHTGSLTPARQAGPYTTGTMVPDSGEQRATHSSSEVTPGIDRGVESSSSSTTVRPAAIATSR